MAMSHGAAETHVIKSIKYRQSSPTNVEHGGIEKSWSKTEVVVWPTHPEDRQSCSKSDIRRAASYPARGSKESPIAVRMHKGDRFGIAQNAKAKTCDDAAAHTSPEQVGDLMDFLKNSLKHERSWILAELEQRHEALLAAVSSRFGDHPAVTSPYPAPPQLLPSEVDGQGNPDDEHNQKSEHGLEEEESASHPPSKGKAKMAFQKGSFVMGNRNPEGLPIWYPSVLVKHPWFDAVFCAVIILNVLIMALDVQYRGMQIGHEIGFAQFNRSAKDTWPGADTVFEVLEYVFGVIFTFEIAVKICGQRERFICEAWNWIDTTIVAFWAVDRLFTSVQLPVSASVMRLVRMARLLRLVRLVRTIQGFDSLYIMTTAIYGSLNILLWSFVLLLLVQITIAFALNQLLEATVKDGSNLSGNQLTEAQRHKVFEYFGTTSRALLSMFELTLGNWPVIARILQENVSEYLTLFSISYKLLIGFAVVGVVNGVFMQETFKVASSDDRIMLQQKQRDIKKHTKKMQFFLQSADSSGDGVVDKEEFKGILENEDVKAWLAAQELSVGDASNLFALLDDGDGELSAEELVKGVARLKGAARSIDMAIFMREHRAFVAEMSTKFGLNPEGGTASKRAGGVKDASRR
eukprot:TRINITY_DN1566_c0_g2_i1.p1 TRINITY_DN1566_c0_g2~~TRINITY_DN1566_c0_g2_i1.p1  ORF type:complete len:633 (-),score=119.26 TRINITY_DN1566_c0_g2_i1:125-2023(-)